MEYKIKVTRVLQNIRISVTAGVLINTGNYENIRREVGMEADVLDCEGDTDAVRNDRLSEAFLMMHDGVSGLLSATVADAVPENHELASTDRKAAYKERVERERREDKERREKATAARRAKEEAEREYKEVTDNCNDCKERYALNERDPETGGRHRYCQKHVEGWALLMNAHKVEDDAW